MPERGRMLTVKQAAEQLGVQKSLVYEMFRRARIQGYRVEGAIRIPQDAVDQYLAEHSNQAAVALAEPLTPPARPPAPRILPARPRRRGNSSGVFRHIRMPGTRPAPGPDSPAGSPGGNTSGG